MRLRAGLATGTFAAATTALLAFAPGAFAFFTTPHGVSPNAESINSLYTITLVLALVIFFAVEGALLYAVIKFRARRGAAARQIHGNTRLEMGWTLGAALVLVVLAVVTFIKLSSIQNPPNSGPGGLNVIGESGTLFASANRRLPPNHKSLNITVIGRQYLWEYIYPGALEPDGLGAAYSFEEMVVPVNTTVTLDVVSEDVIHVWWIPELGGKFQAVPGLHDYTWFKASKTGLYRGQCAFLCGRGHARMIASVRVVTPAQYEAWLAERKKQLIEADEAAEKVREKLATQQGAGKVSIEE
jgi:cytochrome c oxidase subunit II